jgi:uncharacterized membrane protein YidH (DUF202 family)
MATTAAQSASAFLTTVKEKAKPFLTPYYLTVTAVLGLISVVFGVVILLLILVVTNFNLLGAVE